VDGYALIYRAFVAMIARPLTTRRGENTSAAWGVANFLLRLLERRRPDYLAWVHDVGESFRHQTYPQYKAPREKLTAGPQQALELLKPFGDLDAILANAERISGKRAREAVQQHADLARLSRELVTIKRDVPLPLDLDRLRVQPPDVARLTELFTELEFRSLIPKLASLEPAATATAVAVTPRVPVATGAPS